MIEVRIIVLIGYFYDIRVINFQSLNVGKQILRDINTTYKRLDNHFDRFLALHLIFLITFLLVILILFVLIFLILLNFFFTKKARLCYNFHVEIPP